MFFSVITKNLNWEILTKNLFTFKRWDEFKMNNFNIMGLPENQIFKGGSWKTSMPKNGRAWTVCEFKKGLRKKVGVVFLRGLDTPIHTIITNVFCQFSIKCLLKYFVQRIVDKILQKHLLCISSELLLYLYF